MGFAFALLAIIVGLYMAVNGATSPTTKCSACKAVVSKRARMCPRCGDPR